MRLFFNEKIDERYKTKLILAHSVVSRGVFVLLLVYANHPMENEQVMDVADIPPRNRMSKETLVLPQPVLDLS